MTYCFSEKEKAEAVAGYESGESIRILAQKFGCSHGPIEQILKSEIENYEKIAKKHKQEAGQKLGFLSATEKTKEIARKIGPKKLAKWKKEHPEEQAERGRKTIRKKFQASQKAHPSIYEKRFKKALEDENISFKWQSIIDFPEGSFNHFAIVDFLVNENLIIEIDGSSHQIDPAYDIQRDEICLNLGYTIFRFSHDDIKNHLDFCIKQLKEVIYHG